MGARGRKTSDDHTISHTGKKQNDKRPAAPRHLSPEAKAEWKAICAALPADWFRRDMWGLLEQYCNVVVSSRVLAKRIRDLEKTKDFKISDYDKLLRMRDNETRQMSSLATKMRLTQQSTYDKKVTKPKTGKTPWG